MLTLLSSSIPLEYTFTSVILGILSGSDEVVELDKKNIASLESLHVFAFTSKGELLLAQSEGSFTPEQWEIAHDSAESICCGSATEKDRMQVEGEVQNANLQQWLRDTVQDRIDKDQAWKR